MRRAGLEPQEVEMVVLGHALPAGEISRPREKNQPDIGR